jgi:hypothetical protein
MGLTFGSGNFSLSGDRSMISSRVPLALMLVMVAVLLVAGCISHYSFSPSTTMPLKTPSFSEAQPVQTPAIAISQELNVVSPREPFIYRARINDTGVHSVDVMILSQPDEFYPAALPLDENGTFTLFLGGNFTRKFWEDYSYILHYPPYREDLSPYLHVILRYPGKQERLDVLIAVNETNRTIPENNTWIQIDPLRDVIVLPENRLNYTGPFFINGITSLPPGTNLSLEISSLCFWPCPKYDPEKEGSTLGCCGTEEKYEAFTLVKENTTGQNTWSFPVNTSPVRIVIGTENGQVGDTNRFRALVKDVNRTIDDNRWDLADFVVRVQGVP